MNMLGGEFQKDTVGLGSQIPLAFVAFLYPLITLEKPAFIFYWQIMVKIADLPM